MGISLHSFPGHAVFAKWYELFSHGNLFFRRKMGNSLEHRYGEKKVGISEALPGSNISQGSELRASISGWGCIRKELP